MGILYSHLVFQPPVPPTYADCAAEFSFRRIRSAYPDDALRRDEDQPAQPEYVSHPIFYLKTAAGNTIPAAYFHQPRSHFTILFSHGNGEDLGITASYAQQLANALSTSVLCYDYAGYGLATGKPSESNCYADIRAAYNHLTQKRNIPPNRILLFGRSLGSGPTLHLASSLGHDLGGVVLIAPLLSCIRVVLNFVPATPRFDMFANIDRISRVQVPVFCVHGMVDNVVPFSHGLLLTKRAKYPLEPLWIRDASHNNLESSRFQYRVFLRYMTVLQEFRRWYPPVETPHLQANPNSKPGTSSRSQSAKRLGKVANCFGPRSQQTNITEQDTSSTPKSPRRAKDSKSRSSSYLNLPNVLKTSGSTKLMHENDLRALWGASEHGTQLSKTSSDSDIGSTRKRPLRLLRVANSFVERNTSHMVL